MVNIAMLHRRCVRHGYHSMNVSISPFFEWYECVNFRLAFIFIVIVLDLIKAYEVVIVINIFTHKGVRNHQSLPCF